MIQSGSGSGLAPETVQGIRFASEFVTQELERDRALEPGVFGLLDLAHPAAAEVSHNEVSHNVVMRDGIPIMTRPANPAISRRGILRLRAGGLLVRQA